jgi:hypothetical protein
MSHHRKQSFTDDFRLYCTFILVNEEIFHKPPSQTGKIAPEKPLILDPKSTGKAQDPMIS